MSVRKTEIVHFLCFLGEVEASDVIYFCDVRRAVLARNASKLGEPLNVSSERAELALLVRKCDNEFRSARYKHLFSLFEERVAFEDEVWNVYGFVIDTEISSSKVIVESAVGMLDAQTIRFVNFGNPFACELASAGETACDDFIKAGDVV